jgi:MFS transporter, MHS family, proline/betaine transporter
MSAYAAPATDQVTRRRVIFAGCVGNLLEWFDFAVYAYFASVIGGLFFPSEDPVASTLATFAVFGVGFFMRPLGGVLFGHFGDKLGRRAALSASIILMALSTLSIGLLPTYAQIGVLAPILLVVARLAQGLSVGGEYSGSSSFMVEYAPTERRGLYGSLQQAAIGAGLLLGSVLATVLTSFLTEDSLNAWGWRVPFVLGIVVGAVGLYLRRRIEDTPAFRAVEETHEVQSAPVVEALRRYWKQCLIAIGFTMVFTVSYYTFLTYMPTYLTNVVGISSTLALISNSIGLLFHVLIHPPLGVLSDRVGRRPLLIAASVAFVVLTYPAFLVMSTGNFALIVLVQLFFGFLVALFSAPAPAALVELFPTKVRYSAFGVSYNLAVAAFGGSAPFIATFLIQQTGSDIAPAFYVVLAGIVTTIVILGMRETYREPLR